MEPAPRARMSWRIYFLTIAAVAWSGVLVAVLGFQALAADDWIAIAGVTLWVKLFASFALSRQAHGLGPKTKAKKGAPGSDKSS